MLAIFMIVTLAAIAVYLLTISNAQVHATTQDEESVRAYQAARAGTDWGAYRLLHDASCASAQLVFTTNGLSGFYAEVACQEVGAAGGESEGTATIRVYRITATGCNANPCTPATAGTPGSSAYVERQIQLTVTRTL